MEYLVLSIISSTCIFLIFKQFSRYEIDNFQAIVFNYLTAASIGFFLSSGEFEFDSEGNNTWIWMAFFMGILFISMFNVIAQTTQKIGISVASVASKISLVIPVLVGVHLYGDDMNLFKAGGIVLAVLSVFLTFHSNDGSTKLGKLWILPAILFVGTGVLDALMKFTQAVLLSEALFNIFSSILFAVAGIIGLAVVLINMVIKGGKFQFKNLIAGVALGVPNYGSIYFLLQTLEHTNMDSSEIYPINNMGIVALSAIAAYLIFKEKMSPINWLGIAVSIIAIGIISFT